jgi:hypothetical protein
MEILKFFIVCVSFIMGQRGFFSPKTVMTYSINGMFISILINQLTDEKSLLLLSTTLNIICISFVCGLIFASAGKNSPNSRRTLKNTYIYYVLFVLIIIIHNLIDTFSHLSSGMENALTLANPWGLMVSFIFVFVFNSNTFINYTSSNSFKRTIYTASFVLFFLVLAVSFGVIKGNTEKVIEDVGGIGLRTFSTNETALMGMVLSVYILDDSRKNGFNLLRIFCIMTSLFVIIVTRSRIGIFSIGFIFAIHFLSGLRKKPLASAALAILIACVSLPFIDVITKIVLKRFQNDVNQNLGFSTVSGSLGTTLSGRTLIWEAYLDQFLGSLTHNPIFLYFGSGYNQLLKMYTDSFLPLIGFKSLKFNFYPLHSDLLLIFIVSGVVGLFIWWVEFITVVKMFFKSPSFIGAAFLWVLFTFSMIDMLNYSPLSSLLIGLGISQNKIYS